MKPERDYEGSYISVFGSAAEPLDESRWRLWYSVLPEVSRFNIAVAIGVPGQDMQRHPAVLSSGKAVDAVLSLGNLPEGWRPVTPTHISLPNGTHRIYFWVHGPGVVRYLAADSSDGRRFEVLDPYRPCLYHPKDRAVERKVANADGLTPGLKSASRPNFEPAASPELICNDATNVYLLPDGSYEMYTVELIPVSEDDPRYIAHDNAAGLFRVIERRTSQDGIHWSRGQRVLAPDGYDPPDLQFYYLSVIHTPAGLIGMLGHYRVGPQTMDIEWCFSSGGVHWQRPRRKPWFLRNEEKTGILGVYASHAAVYHAGEWWFFYGAVNYSHNFKWSTGPACADIRLAKIPALYREGSE